ncbi:hypothetical protein NA56DRAFT_652109 [Hyaloscypha hepaticicola]|uniref:Uncharacterized protein n=1 Tax=Hyaloscypha hepaticicola TaxID=2082293 RepID=A0A2J6PGE7_9HELO|nr:hypothetical protein NA56DRAFT_652109 [Hyaloscypha hepaticicola]
MRRESAMLSLDLGNMVKCDLFTLEDTSIERCPPQAGRHITCLCLKSIYIDHKRFIGLPHRPNLRGWWICCQEGRQVNPNIWGDICPDCSHSKCDYCTRL